jgi:hypothetical protein
VRITDDDVKTLRAFHHRGNRFTTQSSCDNVLYLADLQSLACQRFIVRNNIQLNTHNGKSTLKLLYLAFAAFALTTLNPLPGVADEPNVHQLVQTLHDEWADIFYGLPVNKQSEKLETLLPRAHNLVE